MNGNGNRQSRKRHCPRHKEEDAKRQRHSGSFDADASAGGVPRPAPLQLPSVQQQPPSQTGFGVAARQYRRQTAYYNAHQGRAAAAAADPRQATGRLELRSFGDHQQPRRRFEQATAAAPRPEQVPSATIRAASRPAIRRAVQQDEFSVPLGFFCLVLGATVSRITMPMISFSKTVFWQLLWEGPIETLVFVVLPLLVILNVGWRTWWERLSSCLGKRGVISLGIAGVGFGINSLVCGWWQLVGPVLSLCFAAVLLEFALEIREHNNQQAAVQPQPQQRQQPQVPAQRIATARQEVVGYRRYTNDFELVVRATRNLEALLAQYYGASRESGLHASVARLEAQRRNSSETASKLRQIVKMRNELVHENQREGLANRHAFADLCNSVECDLQRRCSTSVVAAVAEERRLFGKADASSSVWPVARRFRWRGGA